jgi:HrpA-like RNA helicase
MTDGLLKMRVIFNEAVFDKIDVLVIDEIHERSINIDILLLLLNDYFRK